MNLIIVFLSSFSVTSAFTTPTTSTRYATTTIASQSALVPCEQPRLHRGNTPRGMAAGDEASGTKKRRKRKDGKQFASSVDAAPPATNAANEALESSSVQIQPKPNTVVMQVRDIRNVLSGVDSAPSSVQEDAWQEEEEWEYYDDDDDEGEEEEDSKTSLSDKRIGRTQDDSMEQLLADARRMRASSSGNTDDGVQSAVGKENAMSDTFFEVVSTIVTIDFFVVIALLVWFLAGIFCSSVLKNDAVQIAFNMNFERVTQPALGILMIGSVAGALGKKDEKEE